jgi:hypothetical protein
LIVKSIRYGFGALALEKIGVVVGRALLSVITLAAVEIVRRKHPTTAVAISVHLELW